MNESMMETTALCSFSSDNNNNSNNKNNNKQISFDHNLKPDSATSTSSYTTNNNNNSGKARDHYFDSKFASLNDYIKSNYGSMSRSSTRSCSETAPAPPPAAAVTTTTTTTTTSGSSDNTNNNNNNKDNNNIFQSSAPLFNKHDDHTVSSNNYSSCNSEDYDYDEDNNNNSEYGCGGRRGWSLRRIALELSLYLNLIITFTKLIAYIQTLSLSVLAALLDSVLDVVSQIVLNYTEKHSSMSRSSAFYPAGASRLEPIGVLTCAALMGMASFEVLKESTETLIYKSNTLEDLSLSEELFSFWSMLAIVVVKLLLLFLCQTASNRRSYGSSKAALQLADPTLEALAQDHWNDALSNSVAAAALLFALYSDSLWFLDPVGAIVISLYIIYSWYHTGKEQIEHLTGKAAPNELIDELMELANYHDGQMVVDTCRAYHFGPKFLVELEVVMDENTPLKKSHDLGMELQYEIEAREEVERCFVHIDYETRDYDEHVVSKVPELREQLLRRRQFKSHASV